MPFPRKFKHLIEIKPGEIPFPDTVWCTYAVCAVEHDSCTWGGWVLESVMASEKELPAATDPRCPECGKPLFRTESIKLVPAADHTPHLVQGRDYTVAPIEYE